MSLDAPDADSDVRAPVAKQKPGVPRPDSALPEVEGEDMVAVGRRVLVVHSADASFIEANRHRWESLATEDGEVVHVQGPLRQAWRKLRGEKFDAAAVFFTLEHSYGWLRMLPWLAAIPRIAVFEQDGRVMLERPAAAIGFLVRRALFRKPVPHYRQLVLLVQTEVEEYVARAAQRLREELNPEAELVVLCRAAGAEALRPGLGGCRVIAVRRGLFSYWKARREIVRLQPDIAVGIFTGRFVHLKNKLFFLSLNVRQRWVFNAGMDYYRLTVRSFRRIFRREKLLVDTGPVYGERIVVLETDGAAETRAIIDRLAVTRAAGIAPVTVLCREETQNAYRDAPGVNRIVTYSPGSSWKNLKAVVRLAGTRSDAVAAGLTGRAGFGWTKALFFLSRTSSRLVFNADKECYYLNWRTARLLLSQEPAPPRRIVLFESETSARTAEGIRAIRRRRFAQEAEIVMVCRDASRPRWEQHCEVDRVIAYSGNPLLSLWRLRREIRAEGADALVFHLTQRPVYRLERFSSFLMPAYRRIAITATSDWFRLPRQLYLRPDAWRRLFRRQVLYPHRVLLLQTDEADRVLQAIATLRKPTVAPRAEILVLCRERDREIFESHPECAEVMTYRSERWRDLLRLRKALSDQELDLVAALFTSRRAYRRMRRFFFLVPAIHRLAINGTLDCSYLPRLAWMRPGPIRLMRGPDPEGPRRLLLIQTSDHATTLEAIDTIRQEHIAPRAAITILCREDRRHLFEDHPQCAGVITYRRGGKSGGRELARSIRNQGFDVVAAVFTGEPTFRRSKLLFLMARAGARLVINPSLDCFYLNWRTAFRLMRMRKERRVSAGSPNGVLLIQTEDDETTAQAVASIRLPEVATVGRLTVFCRKDKAKFFVELPGVDDVVTYRREAAGDFLKTALRLRRLRIDVAAAVLSGRSIFRSQKLLFFLCGARHRLVFNENLDCFYLSKRNFGRLFTLRGNPYREMAGLQRFFRLAAKFLLVGPRFLYLVIWVTFMAIRRTYILRSEERLERG